MSFMLSQGEENPYIPPKSEVTSPIPDLSGKVVDGYRVFRNPRLAGLGTVGVSVAILVLLWAVAYYLERTSVVLLGLTMGLMAFGGFLVVVGQPTDEYGAPKSWWKRGAIFAFAFGTLLGLIGAWFLVSPF